MLLLHLSCLDFYKKKWLKDELPKRNHLRIRDEFLLLMCFKSIIGSFLADPQSLADRREW